jgi:hypothetical protein
MGPGGIFGSQIAGILMAVLGVHVVTVYISWFLIRLGFDADEKYCEK